ncbi:MULTISPECIES: hypothetical protein [Spirulina sp. CCY15215]|nr:hypothetical protein [Spirulina major]
MPSLAFSPVLQLILWIYRERPQNLFCDRATEGTFFSVSALGEGIKI